MYREYGHKKKVIKLWIHVRNSTLKDIQSQTARMPNINFKMETKNVKTQTIKRICKAQARQQNPK